MYLYVFIERDRWAVYYGATLIFYYLTQERAAAHCRLANSKP